MSIINSYDIKFNMWHSLRAPQLPSSSIRQFSSSPILEFAISRAFYNKTKWKFTSTANKQQMLIPLPAAVQVCVCVCARVCVSVGVRVRNVSITFILHYATVFRIPSSLRVRWIFTFNRKKKRRNSKAKPFCFIDTFHTQCRQKVSSISTYWRMR